MFRQSQARVNSSLAIQPAKPSFATPAHRSSSHPRMGNQAAQRLLGEDVIQAKLTVNQPGDRFEQEADRVADAVMRMPMPSAGISPDIQRSCSGCGAELDRKESISIAQTQDGSQISAGNKPNVIQRVCKKCEKELQAEVESRDNEKQIVIQTKSAHLGRPSSTTLDASELNPLKGGGQPLPVSEQSFFEQRMGHDFRGVRVHTDTHADELARAAGARAFTHGGHVVFRAGEYAPSTSAGRHLLAHELTHTVQQATSPSAMGHASPTKTALKSKAGVGQSEVRGIQRLCEVISPPAMDCREAMDKPTSAGTRIRFGLNRSDPIDQYLGQLRKAEGRWRSMNTAQAGDLVANLGH
jgi:hypothetical protein